MKRNSRFADNFLLSAIPMQLIVDDDPIIIIGASMDTGGIGDCFTENDMFSGEPGARVYFNNDGSNTFVGYHQVREGADDYDEYYDVNGDWIDLSEYLFDFSLYVGEVYDLWCDDMGFGGL